MTNALPIALLLGLAAAAAEVLGGYLLVARGTWPRRAQLTMLALGAGFILGLVFLKILPESWTIIGAEASLAMLAGFGTLHFFEHTVVGHLHFGEETHKEAMASRMAGLSAFSGLFIHAFFDGLSISVSVQFDVFLGLLVFFAVLLHKFPEGLTIGSIMLSAGFSKRAVMQAALGIGVATVLGAASLMILPTIDEVWVARILAFSAGTVLYVGATDLIPELNTCEERMPPLMVFVGIALFALSEHFLAELIGH
jgi:zinc transporter ZupT